RAPHPTRSAPSARGCPPGGEPSPERGACSRRGSPPRQAARPSASSTPVLDLIPVPWCSRAQGFQLSFSFSRQHWHMRLLVVGDDPSVREALALVLDLNGFQVATAADGREAIRTLAHESPDAVILDVLMPGIDGLEVCRRMRAGGDSTPVLMLTARTEVS